MNLKPGRRWLRFSPRTLLILMTIAAAILGWRVEKVRKMNAALAELARRGVDVSHYVGDDPAGIVTGAGS